MEAGKSYSAVRNAQPYVVNNGLNHVPRTYNIQHGASSTPAMKRTIYGQGVNVVRPVAGGAPLLTTPRAGRMLTTPHSAPHSLTLKNQTSDILRFDSGDFKRSSDKSKGLRHFSTKVCEKVKEKGRTNYNEVADELVNEYFDSHSVLLNDEKHQYDMKNIRRRVYDALNVLLAMNIIEKNKKDIDWVGLPTSSAQEFKRLEEDKIKRQERIREKTETLQEMIIQLVAYKTLVEKNREREREEGRPADNAVLYLPYVIVNTEKRAMVDCAVSHDKSEFLFNFDQPFEIHDDVEVLKRLGLAHGLERGEVAPEMMDKVKSCLPPALRDYVDQIIEGSLVSLQQDSRKPVQYLIQEQGCKAPVLHRTARPTTAVVARPVTGARYAIMQKNSQQATQNAQNRRYHQVMVRNGTGGAHRVIYTQAPQAQQITTTVRSDTTSSLPQYVENERAYTQDQIIVDQNGRYVEMFDEIESEENVEYQ